MWGKRGCGRVGRPEEEKGSRWAETNPTVKSILINRHLAGSQIAKTTYSPQREGERLAKRGAVVVNFEKGKVFVTLDWRVGCAGKKIPSEGFERENSSKIYDQQQTV